jgi:hypothetical protein
MKTLLTILLALATASAVAAELAPVRQDGHLGARIQGTSLPDSFSRDLTSGLTNRLMIRFTLHQAARELHGRSVEIAIRYDLWDQTFTMTTMMDGVGVDTATYQETRQVIHRLREINLPELFPTSSVPADTELVMRAIVLLNPIDRERMDAIRKWVARNNKRSSLDPAGALAAGDASVSNAILERIFEQYASGADVASAWQQTLTTPPFHRDDLPHESR